jgi:hypothetical protein
VVRSRSLKQRQRNFDFLIHGEINNLERKLIWWPPQEGGNFDEFKWGVLHEKYAATTLNFGTISVFA